MAMEKYSGHWVLIKIQLKSWMETNFLHAT